MPHVSIVMPAFNVAPYIGKAIESILAQPYRDRELIVVNDGSTDDLAAAVHPYLADIVYVDLPRVGKSAACNRAIERSSGDIVMVFDSDDVMFPDVLDRMVAFMDGHPGFGVVTTYGRKSRFRRDDQARWIVQYNFLVYNALVRRELYERHGMHDEALRACVDWELWIRLIAAGVRIGGMFEATFYHRLREGSISHDFRQSISNELAMFERVIEKGIELPGLESRLCVARGRQAAIDHDYPRARRYLRSALWNGEMPTSGRLKLAPLAVAPALSSRAYRWLARARQRFLSLRQNKLARKLKVRV